MEELLSPLTRNLRSHGELSAAECARIEEAAARSISTVGERRDIIREGEVPSTIKIVLDGWVARYKQLPDGRRQILSLMIPGDICDANAFILERMDHSLGALTAVQFARIERTEFEALMAGSPAITRALWRSELVTASIQREWTASVGQRQALERIAHLFCEMHTRMKGIGLAPRDTCEFPLTQADIGEATGLTPVHVNRMLQALRKDGLIELRSKRLQVLDIERLRERALFDPSYLHI